jgi:hypothetical protein
MNLISVFCPETFVKIRKVKKVKNICLIYVFLVVANIGGMECWGFRGHFPINR